MCGAGVAALVSEGAVTLTTPSGRLRGERYLLHDGSRGMRFLGIPYARPPLGPLRFAVSFTPDSPSLLPCLYPATLSKWRLIGR